MNEPRQWPDSYRQALADVRYLAASRGLVSPQLTRLLDDLENDALVIERETDNRLRRRRLRAATEAMPLFEER